MSSVFSEFLHFSKAKIINFDLNVSKRESNF